jgi:photosystem II stability/assembly factor-like uncharacterized protein
VDTNFYQFRTHFLQGHQGEIDTFEASAFKQFKKFEYVMGPKFSSTGSVQDASEALNDWISDYELNGDGTSSIISSWTSLGPHNTPSGSNGAKGVGRITCIAFDPVNPNNTIYVGSPFGGVWKTNNGGLNWTNLNTDFLPVIRISDIVINPNDNNMIFIATGDKNDTYNRSISAGIYRSTNGGLTWAAVNSGLNFSGFFQIAKILINPINPDEAYLATSTGIYKTTNSTTSCQWTALSDPLVNQKYFRNILYKPDGLYSTIYASGKDIIKSTDGGSNWISITMPYGLDFSSFADYPHPVRINITVSPNSSNMLFACAILTDTPGVLKWNSKKKFLVFIFDGSNWAVKDFLPIQGHPNYIYQSHGVSEGWLPIAVSPLDASHIYIGNVVSWRSLDGGVNWSQNYPYNGVVHADCHDLTYSPDGQTLFIGCDGGFYKINNPAASSS